jgi:hypothetical protein
MAQDGCLRNSSFFTLLLWDIIHCNEPAYDNQYPNALAP